LVPGQGRFNGHKQLLIIERSINIAKRNGGPGALDCCLSNIASNIDNREIVFRLDELAAPGLPACLLADIRHNQIRFEFLDHRRDAPCGGSYTDGPVSQRSQAVLQVVGYGVVSSD
jgi:hypothetical protein